MVVFREVISPKPERWFRHEIRDQQGSLIGRLETQVDEFEGGPIFCVYKLLIKPEFRRRGYGTEAIKFAETLAEDKGFKKIICWVRSLDPKHISQKDIKNFYSKGNFYFKEKGEGSLYALKDLDS